MEKNILLTALLLLNFFYGHLSAQKKLHCGYINVRMEGAKREDTSKLYFWQNVLSSSLFDKFIQPKIYKVSLNENKEWHFQLSSISRPGYFIICKDSNLAVESPIPIFNRYLIEPGDSVTIVIKKRGYVNKEIGWNYSGLNDLYEDYVLTFSGRGSAKYQCRYRIDTMIAKDTSAYGVFKLGTYQYLSRNHYLVAHYIADSLLKAYRKFMSPIAFQILAADLYSEIEIPRVRLLLNKYEIAVSNMDSLGLRIVKNTYFNYFNNDLPIGKYSRGLAISNSYPMYGILDAITKEHIEGNPLLGQGTYTYLKNEYTGMVRDRLLTLLFAREYHVSRVLQPLLQDAQKIVKTSYCLEVLNSIQSSLAKGKTAYNFSLVDTAGNIVTLKKLKGKVIFMDFWFTGCGSCKGYYKNILAKAEDTFKDNPNVVFVSVSVDKLKNVWIKSIYSNAYSSVTHKNVINLYTGGVAGNSPVIRYYKISGYPFQLLIDKSGRIATSSWDDLNTLPKIRDKITYILRQTCNN
ncbi:MAG: redoxin domain-containing protein [Chitinophagaceae bacterium]|nr:MAG: redoxin domain-containing protein [Chitinophagaceae bacterium]